MRRPRVLHAPLNIASDPWRVSRAERAMGLESDLATVQENPFASDADFHLGDRDVGSFRRNVDKLRFTARAMRNYDIFHYSFGTSILDYRAIGLDLIDLRWASRSHLVVMTFHGCDVRAIQPGGCRICDKECGDVEEMKRRYSLIRRAADVVCVKTPDLLSAVSDAHFVPQAVDLEAIDVIPPRLEGPVRCVHSTTSRVGKGTAFVIDAVRKLQESGHDIELDVVEGVSHDEALARYALADVAIGQFHAGWYGVFEIEAMAMGKPVIGWIDDENARAGGITDIPVINCRAEDIERIVSGLIHSPELSRIGIRSRQYVERVHAAPVIAARMIDLYQEHWDGEALAWPVREAG